MKINKLANEMTNMARQRGLEQLSELINASMRTARALLRPDVNAPRRSSKEAGDETVLAAVLAGPGKVSQMGR